jgi:hypothetical protein
MIVPTDVESHAMGYKDHSSNPDIHPRRMSVLPDDESHPWATRTIIHTLVTTVNLGRMNVLNNFPPSRHYCELGENVCPPPISPL